MPRPQVVASAHFKQFLAVCRKLFATRAVTGQDKLDFERAKELMQKHTGVTILPWQKPKPRETTPAEPARKGGIPRSLVFFMAIAAVNLMRVCNPSTHSTDDSPSYAPPSSPRFDDPRYDPQRRSDKRDSERVQQQLDALLRKAQNFPAPMR
jgi:hypothetical protein